MNISSVVIRANAADLAAVRASIEEFKDVEVHIESAEKGILIASICAESMDAEIAIVKGLEKIAGVIDVAMHYSYAEDELESARQNLDFANPVANFLNDDSIPLESIKYAGDVNNFIKSK